MWVSILVSIVAVLVSLHFLINWSTKRNEVDAPNSSIQRGNKISGSMDLLFHVLGILVKQGQILRRISCISYDLTVSNAVTGNSFVVRYWPILFVVGTWSVASLILTNYYTVLLISHVTAPNPKPLITSIYELRNRPEIHLVTDKGRNTDSILTVLKQKFVWYPSVF